MVSFEDKGLVPPGAILAGTPKSAPAFTPGPWRVDPNCRGDIQSADGFEIGSVYSKEDVGTVLTIGIVGAFVPDEQCDANARLIAAAPDLLDALQALTDQCVADFGAPDEWDGDDEPVGHGSDGGMAVTFGAIRKAQAAIAKATGQ